jgi:biopolymer transport protein ExbB/TolQ
VLHAAVEDDGKFDFDEKEKKVFAKRVYNELLEKITALEHQLALDTTKLVEAARVQEIQRQREEELEGLDGRSQVSGVSRQYSNAMSRAGSRYDLGMGRAGTVASAAPSRQASRANTNRRQSLIKGLKARLTNTKF